MKEIQKIGADPTAIHAQKEVQKQKVLLGKLRPYPGQTVWELNLKTKEIVPATIITTAVINKSGQPVTKRDIFVKEHCIYKPALNLPNARKQFAKVLIKYLPKTA